MWNSLKDYLLLAAAYMRINLNAQLEYRGAFISEAIAMLINDAFWVAFWVVFFQRFPILRGWNVSDVLTLWAITASGFGIAFAAMGNTLHLAGLIVNGQLDAWMLQPRILLTHLLLGKTVATAWGDALFGYIVFAAFVRPDAAHFAMFALLTFSTALVFVGFGVLSSSRTFFVGNGGFLAEQWRYALITFSTYPDTLFSGAVKVVLFTAIPAGFVSYMPVRVLHSLSLAQAGIALLGALAVLAAGWAAFSAGLRRYESGNLISMNG